MKTTWKLKFFITFYRSENAKLFAGSPFASLKERQIKKTVLLIDELANDFWLYISLAFALKLLSHTNIPLVFGVRACDISCVCDDYQLTNIKVNDPQQNGFYNTFYTPQNLMSCSRFCCFFFLLKLLIIPRFHYYKLGKFLFWNLFGALVMLVTHPSKYVS